MNVLLIISRYIIYILRIVYGGDVYAVAYNLLRINIQSSRGQDTEIMRIVKGAKVGAWDSASYN